MKNCNIIITSENNGKKTELHTKGIINFFDNRAEVSYCDENNLMKFLIGANAVFSRIGDYGYTLNFASGKTLPAEMTIGENTGTFSVKTLSYCYKIEETGVKLFLSYLLFGECEQKFTVKMNVNIID